jgi:hypothetical protein
VTRAPHKLSPAAIEDLERLAFRPDSDPVIWWHDLCPGARERLLADGLIEEQLPRTRCQGSHGISHPGYMKITDAGLAAIGRKATP